MRDGGGRSSTCDALHDALNDAALGDAGGLDLHNLSAHDHLHRLVAEDTFQVIQHLLGLRSRQQVQQWPLGCEHCILLACTACEQPDVHFS